MQRFSACQRFSSDSKEQTILESLTSSYSYDLVMAPILNQNETSRGNWEQSQYNPSPGSLHGDTTRHCDRFTNKNKGNRYFASVFSNITGAYNKYSADNNSCPMDASSNENQPNIFAPIDTTAIYRFALNLVCRGDSAQAIVNPAASCSREDAARISASILFNLGLVYHVIAGDVSSFLECHRGTMTSGDLSDRVVQSLQYAKAYYQLSLKLQESEKAPISNHNLMALCNNIGQCYVGLHRHSESIAWAERLLRLLVCSQQSGESRNKPKHGSECFIRNTSHLILRDPCTAPTA
eukprot:jgi/Psemu1/301988/fgenesh1_kg.54_\